MSSKLHQKTVSHLDIFKLS